MNARETRPISERRTELGSSAEIFRRLLFLLMTVGGPAGVILVIVGLSRGHLSLTIGGAVLVLVALLAWWRRASWGAAATIEEIKRNPFAPPREPKP